MIDLVAHSLIELFYATHLLAFRFAFRRSTPAL